MYVEFTVDNSRYNSTTHFTVKFDQTIYIFFYLYTYRFTVYICTRYRYGTVPGTIPVFKLQTTNDECIEPYTYESYTSLEGQKLGVRVCFCLVLFWGTVHRCTCTSTCTTQLPRLDLMVATPAFSVHCFQHV